MTIQYGLLIQSLHQTKHVGDMNGEYTFFTLEGALSCGYALYKDGEEVMSIFEYDTDTGDVKQHLNRKQLLSRYDGWTKEEENAEREDEGYGSYSSQHALRLQDVLH